MEWMVQAQVAIISEKLGRGGLMLASWMEHPWNIWELCLFLCLIRKIGGGKGKDLWIGWRMEKGGMRSFVLVECFELMLDLCPTQEIGSSRLALAHTMVFCWLDGGWKGGFWKVFSLLNCSLFLNHASCFSRVEKVARICSQRSIHTSQHSSSSNYHLPISQQSKTNIYHRSWKKNPARQSQERTHQMSSSASSNAPYPRAILHEILKTF